MEIYLNGQKLDFRLERERTVADVASAIEQWLAGSLCVSDIAVDGKPTPSQEWQNIALSGARRMDVSVVPLSEARIAALRTAADFLRLFRSALSGRDKDLLGDLAGGYPSMVEGVRSIMAPQPGGELFTHLVELDRTLAGNTPERIVQWPEETLQAACRAADGVAAAVASSLQEADDPTAALPRLRTALLAALTDVEQVSVLLQTGKDRQAMGTIIGVSELAERLIAAISRLRIADRPVPDVQSELNAALKQLLEAFSARDTVLIGDLLEYEIAPRLRQIVAAAGEMERSAGGAGHAG